MYNAINFSYTNEWVYSGAPIIGPNPTDYTVNTASIATLLCPSDGVVNTCSGYAQYINFQPGNFNYVANTGHPRNILLPGDSPYTTNLPPLTGILSTAKMYAGALFCHSDVGGTNTDTGVNVSVTLASITDGTSNTAAVSESLTNDGSGNSPDPRRNIYYTAKGYVDAVKSPNTPALLAVQDGLANPIFYQPWSYFKGLSWAYTDAWEKHTYAHLFPPNTPPIITYHTDTFRCQEGDGGMCPTSNHPGGVNVSFMDGSVHFIKNSINLPTWWNLGTRNKGEIISSDSY